MQMTHPIGLIREDVLEKVRYQFGVEGLWSDE